MNLENNILYSMYNMGVIEDEDMAQFSTIDNQYEFKLRRENYQLWSTDTSYKYKCIIDIYNKITDNLLVSLILTEEDVKNLLDCYTQMDGYGMQNIMVPQLKPYCANGNFYYIILEAYRIDKLNDIMCDLGNRWFTVKEYNPMLNQAVDIVSIQMDVSEMEELMDIIYFIFIIDIESNKLLPANIGPSEYTAYGEIKYGIY